MFSLVGLAELHQYPDTNTYYIDTYIQYPYHINKHHMHMHMHTSPKYACIYNLYKHMSPRYLAVEYLSTQACLYVCLSCTSCECFVHAS